MTWFERIKLAWKTFTREALPLYAWSLISIGGVVVLLYAMFMGLLDQFRWAFPQTNVGLFSSEMPPIPGIPPNGGPFGPSQGPFNSNSGPLGNLSTSLAVAGSVVGILFLIFIVACLIGAAFSAGQFNLTAKAYREKVRFEDFRFSGFLRVLGWQVFLFLSYLIFFIIGLIGAFALSHSKGAVTAFLIVYGLCFTVVQIFILPWLATSLYYLLAHREQRFWAALRSSWRFFRRHMGSLWGYIGTVILIQIALLVLIKISAGLGYLASLAVGPFIVVLAIVWVLSLEEDERQIAEGYSQTQATILNPPPSDSLADNTSSPEPELPEGTAPESERSQINLQKSEPLPLASEDKP